LPIGVQILAETLPYAAPLESIWYRGAYFVDRILKGCKSADLPVEFPTEIKLTLNEKTARLFGMNLPIAMLAAANEIVS
jgi:putative tryptophan/tyrosine transport system substrate-binding protein